MAVSPNKKKVVAPPPRNADITVSIDNNSGCKQPSRAPVIKLTTKMRNTEIFV